MSSLHAAAGSRHPSSTAVSRVDRGFPMWAKLMMWIGFPAFACCAMAWGIWQAAVWTGSHVFDRAMDSHVKTLDKITTATDKLATAFDRQTRVLSKMEQHEAAQTKALEDIHDLLKSRGPRSEIDAVDPIDRGGPLE